MSSLDADVNISLNANDNASPVVDNSVKNIDRSFVQMRNGIRANERSFYLQHQSIFKLNQVMGTMRQVTGAGINVMNTMLLSQIRNQAAARNMADAIRDSNDALAEFGPGSREYNDALAREAEIREQNANNLKQEYLQWVTIGTYLATSIIPALVKISGLTGLAKGKIMPTGSTPSSGVIGPNKPVGKTGGGAPGRGAGVALGYTMIPGAIDWAAQQFGIEKNPVGGTPAFGQTPSGSAGQQWAQIIVNVNGMTESQGVYSE